jgi:hypothetical protein
MSPAIPRLLLILLLFGGHSQAARITDQLVVGVFERPDPETAPIQAITSGTPVEVLESRGAYSRVRLSDNSEGWIEKTYITEDKPARVMLLELQAEAHALRKELAQLRQVALNSSPPTEQTTPQGILLSVWHLLLAAALMIGSFIAGIVYKNYRLTKAAQ